MLNYIKMRRVFGQSFLRAGVDSDMGRTDGLQHSAQGVLASVRLLRSLLFASAGLAATPRSAAATTNFKDLFPILMAS
jgi:hypothetical protein